MTKPGILPLPAMIALLLATSSALAQESSDEKSSVKPGLYTTVDQDEIYIIQGDQQIDLKTGESAYVTPDSLQFIERAPSFLNWPCGSALASDRGVLPSYSFDDLPPGDRIGEIVRRFFEDTEIIQPTPWWLNGESHGTISADEIDQFITDAYWYKTGPAIAGLAAQRPKILLISIFRGTGQVVVDTNYLNELKQHYGSDDIPVVFDYREENEVPISYFGPNPTLQDLMTAYIERGIEAADVPMWYAGDRHMEVTPDDLANVLDLPPLKEINPERLAALQLDLQANGFSRKPITLAMMAGRESIVVDDAERIRAALALGMNSIPIMFSFYNESSPTQRCGLPPPIAAVGALGQSSGEVAPTGAPEVPEEVPPKPPSELLPPPPPEDPASDN